MISVLAVGIGGGAGAVARYAVEGVVASRQRGVFPLSTLVVNVSGSTALGALLGLWGTGTVPAAVWTWVVAGFFGGFTTFSTFVYETLQLAEAGARRHVVWNLALSGPVSFAGAAGGYALTRLLTG